MMTSQQGWACLKRPAEPYSAPRWAERQRRPCPERPPPNSPYRRSGWTVPRQWPGRGNRLVQAADTAVELQLAADRREGARYRDVDEERGRASVFFQAAGDAAVQDGEGLLFEVALLHQPVPAPRISASLHGISSRLARPSSAPGSYESARSNGLMVRTSSSGRSHCGVCAPGVCTTSTPSRAASQAAASWK